MEITDYGPEIFRQCIARTPYIQFFLHEVFGLESHFAFGIADAYHPAGECDLIHCRHICGWTSNGFDNYVRSQLIRHFQQTFMHILRA